VLERVDRMIMTHAEAETVVVLAGSVPDGIEDRVYRDLVATLASRGARVVLDTSGMPLRAALAGEVDALPYCIKPNRAELETLVGHPLPTVEDVGRAARDLVGRGVRLVVVSLGKDGALFADAGHTLQASLPLVSGVSTVGAGDAMVSGIVAALIGGVALEDVARLSTAFAVAKLGQKGPNLPSRGAVEASARDVCVIPRP
jgi:1-phosphofructokinase